MIRGWTHRIGLAGLAVSVLLAQVATPVGLSAEDALPMAPLPARCHAQPVDFSALAATGTPSAATPVAVINLNGYPVDNPTSVAVTGVVVELFACLNAGEPLRAYALYSERYLAEIMLRQGGLSATSFAALATPQPLDPEERTVLLAIDPIVRLADSRVAANVWIDPALTPVEKLFTFILVHSGDRWLIDDVLDEIEFSIP